MHRLEFEEGLTLIETREPRSPLIYEIVCERLEGTAEIAEGETAYWIDARNAAMTHALYDCASSQRTLSGLRIARAFTAYQHHSLVRAVTRSAGPETELIVAPNVATLYHDPDVPDYEREELLASTLETLAELGRVLECPVVVTSAAERRASTVDDYAGTSIECVRTREGIRLVGGGDDVVTEGYHHGAHWQTTIPYWADLCGTVDRLDPTVVAHDRGLLEVRS
ncbi:hypothetical protein [Natrarchaeobius chitinivorans]|uniref:DNA recombination and repair protein Rad51-like C-terminal domain-containing protein n=1 Tax=Natrarchaeobius chitinivorans TaxID=1679083 RepID=A0A3N6MTA0_NATCH|nr:hypothetical protein [Natrarchaeobius chitinivorans]RQG98016.1 hypothetical protein EA473_02165 [Natrarchaeobius chitinivorans]